MFADTEDDKDEDNADANADSRELQCGLCEAIHGELSELHGEANVVRSCRQCKEQHCNSCKWLEACSICGYRICGECIQQHCDVCSGNRAKRHREVATQRKMRRRVLPKSHTKSIEKEKPPQPSFPPRAASATQRLMTASTTPASSRTNEKRHSAGETRSTPARLSRQQQQQQQQPQLSSSLRNAVKLGGGANLRRISTKGKAASMTQSFALARRSKTSCTSQTALLRASRRMTSKCKATRRKEG